jgi:hypothetical protein
MSVGAHGQSYDEPCSQCRYLIPNERGWGYLDAGADHVAIYVTDDRPLRQFERLMSVLAAAGVPARA